MKRIVLVIIAFTITFTTYSQTQHDAPSNSGNGGYISSGNYGGTGSAAYFPAGLWANGGTSWLYGNIFFNSSLRDNQSTPKWKIDPNGPSWFNGGCVGIGTTNPYGQLQVNSIRPILFNYNGGNGVYGSEIGFNAILNTNVTPNQFKKLGGTSQLGGAAIVVDNWGSMYFQTYNANTENESITTYNPQITFQNNGNVGIGTTAPLVGLHVTKTIDYNGLPIAAIFGNNYYDWTQFGGLTAGRIRGSNEGYLVVEGNPKGTGDKSLYLNYSSNGNVIIATGGGNVGIGTHTPGNFKLAVEGTIGAREVKVTTAAWADFVFRPTYKLRTLGEVEQFIKTNNHLPEIPTEAEVKENGIGLGEMNAKLLQKIEELTLYMIELKKANEDLKNRVSELEKK